MTAILRTALGKGREFDLIRRFVGPAGISSPAVLVGPGDDCAIVAGERIALTIDLSIEDVHFRRDWLEPEEIGARAAAAALSDLAAVAAKPIGLLAAIALPMEDARNYAARVIDGVRSVANEHGAMLLGGDVSRSLGPLVLDIAAVGSVEQAVLRSGARPGDSLWVTGRLGGAAAAVAAWLEDREPSAEARAAFVQPVPRWREARWLAERGALHALIDLSDGLAGDAGHVAAASNVRIVLEASSIPIHGAARVGSPDHPLDLALHGGEDYELLLAAPAGVVERIVAEFERAFGLPLTRVGDVVEGEDVVLRTQDGEQELTGGFDHFTRTAS